MPLLDIVLTLLDVSSPTVHLSHPTLAEAHTIWTFTSAVWNGALSVSQYVENAAYLLTVPLNKDGGMTQWVLVDRTLSPDQRTILASCETIWKRAFVSGLDGNVEGGVVHGVVSVFCDPSYRGRGMRVG
jgi:hypothetical protein